MKILIIDNKDSFIYNIARYLICLGCEVEILRQDVSWETFLNFRHDRLLISPGPCSPKEAGISLSAIQYDHQRGVPILGICLGHQAIGEAFGGEVVRARFPLHGRSSWIHHTEKSIFKDLPQPLSVGRYHSLVVCPKSLPPALEALAWSSEGEIMAIQHRDAFTVGVQFHPESVLTPQGMTLLKNFIETNP